MQILHEAGRPYNITSLTDPLSVTHFWTFSGQMMDFKLDQLEYLEETTGPTLVLDVEGWKVEIPVSWNLIAVERESYTIDTIPVTSCATYEHDLLLFSPVDTKLVTAKARVIDYKSDGVCIHPMVPKASGVAIPVREALYYGKPAIYNIIATPFDLHRYIGGCAVGEILG